MGESVVESLDDYISEMDDSDGWPTLFSKLLQQAMRNQSPCLVAKEAESKTRNRYRDVLPADMSRVKLEVEEDQCDYINANHVKVDEVSRRYILTQGPLPHTAEHFWQMVWEQKSKGIAMLNRVVEKGMRKCHQYFPCRDAQGSDGGPLMAVSFGPYHVRLVSREDKGGYVINKLSLQKTGSEEESREVLHFHYRKWPDFHLPDTAEDFLDYLWALRDAGCLSNDVGPLVVHCSAGIGRSGTLILVDVCLREIELRGDLQGAMIENYLQSMRRQRFGLIQTPEQLRFAYLAIAEGIERVDVPSPANNEAEEETSKPAEEQQDDAASQQTTVTEASRDEAAPATAAAASAVAAATSAETEETRGGGTDSVGQPPCKRPLEDDPSTVSDQPPTKIVKTSDSLNPTGQVSGGASESGSAEGATPGLHGNPASMNQGTRPRRPQGSHSPELAAKVAAMKDQKADAEKRAAESHPYTTYIKWSVAAVVIAGGAYLVCRKLL